MLCDRHPGVTFAMSTENNPMPGCFVCDPDPQPMWRELTPGEEQMRENKGGVAATMDEMVSSGHWPGGTTGPGSTESFSQTTPSGST